MGWVRAVAGRDESAIAPMNEPVPNKNRRREVTACSQCWAIVWREGLQQGQLGKGGVVDWRGIGNSRFYSNESGVYGQKKTFNRNLKAVVTSQFVTISAIKQITEDDRPRKIRKAIAPLLNTDRVYRASDRGSTPVPDAGVQQPVVGQDQRCKRVALL